MLCVRAEGRGQRADAILCWPGHYVCCCVLGRHLQGNVGMHHACTRVVRSMWESQNLEPLSFNRGFQLLKNGDQMAPKRHQAPGDPLGWW